MVRVRFSNRLTSILQSIYNRNKLLAYDTIVMINDIERGKTNYIIQDGIVYDSFNNKREVYYYVQH